MNTEIISGLIKNINRNLIEDIKIMEICGTHTNQIAKLGLKSLLSDRIHLISGPGCPVCVTEEEYIDYAIILLRNYPVTIVTFGDLMRVKGSKESLLDMKSSGFDVIIIHSPLDIINLAKRNITKKYVLLSVGFETTAPIIALTIKKTAEQGLNNIYFLTSLKLMSPVLHHILMDKSNKIDGFICPGHVATIKGSNYFKFISDIYKKPAVITGFEALDIISSIHFLVENIKCDESNFDNYYKRCVSDDGNIVAKMQIATVFDCSDGMWRGIGRLEKSSLVINKEYEFLDARKVFKNDLKVNSFKKTKCQCSDILLGVKSPTECILFGKFCTPVSPQGPCMISIEGTCAIAYKFMEDI